MDGSIVEVIDATPLPYRRHRSKKPLNVAPMGMLTKPHVIHVIRQTRRVDGVRHVGSFIE